MKHATRIALLICGWVFLAVGAIGVVVPILPTVPFLIVAAACFLRSSERLHRWLVDHPIFGRDLNNYLDGKGIRARSKIIGMLAMWISVTISTVFFVPWLAADVVIIVITILVTAHILRLPTAPD